MKKEKRKLEELTETETVEKVKKNKTIGSDVNGRTNFYTEHPEITAMSQKEVEKYREQLNLTVSGNNCDIRPLKTFAQSSLPRTILNCTAKFEKPSPIQAQCWPPLLMGRDVIGIAKTGSGKTLGFMLPAYVMILDKLKKGKNRSGKPGPLVLVLAPTRELALQTAKVCNEMEDDTKIRAACIYGGVDKYAQINAIKSGVEVVIATPGRLLGLLRDGHLTLANVTYAVLDEADRMLDMGFEPDVRAIMQQVGEDRQTLLFSATWPASIQKLGREFVKDPFHVLVGSEDLTANHDVSQIVEVIDERSFIKDKRLLELMAKYHDKKAKNRILVFVLYKKDVGRVERLLQQRGFGATSISSDRTQHERMQALAAFKSAESPVLVGTDVASRGLDIPDVSHVINYSFPLTVEDYIHRIGRTGRGGKKGCSHTLFTKFDKGLAGELVNVLREANAPIPEDLTKFGTGIKRKEHGMYGLHYKSSTDSNKPMPEKKRVVFD